MSLVRPSVTFDNRKSRGELAVELIKAFRLYIVLGLFLALTAIWYFKPELPELPLGSQVALLAVIGSFALGYLPAWKLLDYIYNPPKRYIVVPGLDESAEPGMWELTPAAFSELTLEDGELYQWPGTEHPTYEVEAFNPETLTAKATWRGSVPDSVLIRERERIKQIRDKLETKARERDVLEVRGKALVRQAVMEERRTFLEEYDRVALLDADTYDQQLEELLEETDMQAELSEQQDRKTDPADTDDGGQDQTIGHQVRQNGGTDE